MAYFHHRANVRPHKVSCVETGSPGCASSRLGASWIQAAVPAWRHGWGEEASSPLEWPGWRLLGHQLGHQGERSLGYLHLAILIRAELTGRQSPTGAPHPRKPQWQHVSAGVIRLEMSILGFREAEGQTYSTEQRANTNARPPDTTVTSWYHKIDLKSININRFKLIGD